MSDVIPVTAMLPAHQRIEKTLETIRRIQACQPAPSEIIVHVASSQHEMIEALQSFGDSVRVLLSDENLGPGGARNRMLHEASNEIVASFDDDSYPYDTFFFEELVAAFTSLEEASILALNIFEGVEPVPSTDGGPRWVGGFVGCGCAYRRSHFVEGEGYVPIPVAYSMEEADLTLRYLARGRRVYFVPSIRVYHDTVLSHHASAEVAAMQVANTALFAYLRYPLSKWPLGFAQVCHKWIDTVQRGRFLGALLSFPYIFKQANSYQNYRQTVSNETLKAFLHLKKFKR